MKQPYFTTDHLTAHSFPGHAGRPGQVGGSLPRGSSSGRLFETKDAADEWGMQNQSWIKNISDAEEFSLTFYTATVGLNERLRKGETPDTDRMFGSEKTMAKFGHVWSEKDALEGLDAIFARPEAILKEDVITHRAWTGKGNPKSKKVGATFIDKGFTSTAMSRNEIEVFKTDPNSGKAYKGIEVVIHVPAGTRVLYVGTKQDKSWFADSSELLINRGTKYRVLSNNDGEGRMVLEVIK